MPQNLRLKVAVILCSLFIQSMSGGSDDIVERLFVIREYPTVVALTGSERAEAVRQLNAVRPTAKGKRLEKVAFLLAALGSQYARNRDHLVGVLRACSVARDSDCDEDTAGLLIGLYYRGHREILYPLLAAGLHSDGALSEMLGLFYGEVLIHSPDGFVAALRRLNASGQKAACTLSGGGDGGGMNDLRSGAAKLKQIGGHTALPCLIYMENRKEGADCGASR